MAKKWDHLMKLLAKANPQHLVSFVLPGAVYKGETFTDLEAESRQIEADIMYNVIWYGVETVLHIEFQRRHDEDMGKRVWEYNALGTIIKQLPVCSFVIYLVKDHGIVQPPYQERGPDGNLIRQFYYRNMYLWELPSAMLKRPELEGLLPLAPLTKDGAQRAVVEEMITGLQEAHREDLYSLAYSFAALVFKKTEDRQWLRRRFEMLKHILEESWAYQEMYEEATEKGLRDGLQRGLEQGLEKGREQERQRELQYQRQALATYVEMHFPALASLLRERVEQIEEPEILQRLLITLFAAQSAEDARNMILNA
ncbi:MAG TPA: hypothetical protein VFQ30_05625 [Ktedonobacteraceae bacterium]|nr:hypothetical protein [Ktedonobacteraceae bacterium]